MYFISLHRLHLVSFKLDVFFFWICPLLILILPKGFTARYALLGCGSCVLWKPERVTVIARANDTLDSIRTRDLIDNNSSLRLQGMA